MRVMTIPGRAEKQFAFTLNIPDLLREKYSRVIILCWKNESKAKRYVPLCNIISRVMFMVSSLALIKTTLTTFQYKTL